MASSPCWSAVKRRDLRHVRRWPCSTLRHGSAGQGRAKSCLVCAGPPQPVEKDPAASQSDSSAALQTFRISKLHAAAAQRWRPTWPAACCPGRSAGTAWRRAAARPARAQPTRPPGGAGGLAGGATRSWPAPSRGPLAARPARHRGAGRRGRNPQGAVLSMLCGRAGKSDMASHRCRGSSGGSPCAAQGVSGMARFMHGQKASFLTAPSS